MGKKDKGDVQSINWIASFYWVICIKYILVINCWEFFNSVIFVFSVEGWILCKRGDFKYFMDCLFEIMYDYMISSIASHGFVLKMILVLFHLINLNLILGGWILLQLPQVNFKWSCFSLSSKQMNRPPNTISRELFPRGALIFTVYEHNLIF